jgi:hypothetical protein
MLAENMNQVRRQMTIRIESCGSAPRLPGGHGTFERRSGVRKRRTSGGTPQPIPTADKSGSNSWIAITANGDITVYTGRVDLGTGSETAWGQFVAEELDVPIAKVCMIVGDTGLTPNQEKTELLPVSKTPS